MNMSDKWDELLSVNKWKKEEKKKKKKQQQQQTSEQGIFIIGH